MCSLLHKPHAPKRGPPLELAKHNIRRPLVARGARAKDRVGARIQRALRRLADAGRRDATAAAKAARHLPAIVLEDERRRDARPPRRHAAVSGRPARRDMPVDVAQAREVEARRLEALELVLDGLRERHQPEQRRSRARRHDPVVVGAAQAHGLVRVRREHAAHGARRVHRVRAAHGLRPHDAMDAGVAKGVPTGQQHRESAVRRRVAAHAARFERLATGARDAAQRGVDALAGEQGGEQGILASLPSVEDGDEDALHCVGRHGRQRPRPVPARLNRRGAQLRQLALGHGPARGAWRAAR
jgi:hypothetical protein